MDHLEGCSSGKEERRSSGKEPGIKVRGREVLSLRERR